MIRGTSKLVCVSRLCLASAPASANRAGNVTEAVMLVDAVNTITFFNNSCRVAELARHVSSRASATCGLAWAPVSASKVDNVTAAITFVGWVGKITVSRNAARVA